MAVAFLRLYAVASVCGLVLATTAAAQSPTDTAVYNTTRLDSAQLRRLPLTRDIEATTFLPRTTVGLSYETRVRGSLGGSDVRLDGFPVNNLTFGGTALQIPVAILTAADVYANGTSALFARATALTYQTARGDSSWNGQLSTRTDESMPNSIGLFRVDARGGGPLGALRLNVALAAQSALSTEFNNIGDIPLYGISGTDTTVTFDPGDGTQRTVDVPQFVELDHSRLPGTNWNDVLASARLDILNNDQTRAFATAHYTRTQQLLFGGLDIFNPDAQSAERNTASLLGVVVEHALNAGSRLRLALGLSRDVTLNGVLAPQAITELREQDAGPHFSEFEFLVDDELYPLDESRVSDLRNNTFGVPFPSRFDMVARSEFRMNPYGVTGFTNAGSFRPADTYQFMRETRLYANANWQVSLREHRLLAGAEFTRSTTRGIQTPYVSAFDVSAWIEKPTMFAAFVEDRFSVGRALIQAGLRVDAYQSNAEFSEIPGFLNDESISPSVSSAFSPRIGFALPVGPALVRVNAGMAAHAPTFAQQFRTINQDFFRFANSGDVVFVRPLELVKEHYATAGVQFPVAHNGAIEFSAFHMQTDNEVGAARRPVEDPLNPGSTPLLLLTENNTQVTNKGVDAVGKYRFSARNSVQVGVTYESSDDARTDAIALGERQTSTSIHAIAELASPWRGALNDIELSLGLRASAPIDIEQLLENQPIFQTESSWITRFDARLAKPLRLAGLHGKLWIDGLRLLGSEPFVEPRVNPLYIAAQRQILGGGFERETIPLASVSSAEVSNEVDLALLRQVERRFGNGDLSFTREEQQAAFRAASLYNSIDLNTRSQQRRIVLGIELAF